ncbi:MAG: 4Fe-4S binding protein [Planctomycetes bacterium]|nr:4Fe-4S binding protein [Planctomycetota bacterium]
MARTTNQVSRRDVLRAGGRGAALAGLGVTGAVLVIQHRDAPGELVWQIDPEKCTACGNCETHCVLTPSAVKCLHTHVMCGRCGFCFGYYDLRGGSEAHAGVEYQLCPTDAIRREYLGGPYFEYLIEEADCIACGLCVKGCTGSGNGSLYLQVRHPMPAALRGATPDGTCVNCNQCAIAVACPSDAFVRVPASDPYPFRRLGGAAH